LEVDEAQEISTNFEFSSDGFSAKGFEESCARATEHAGRNAGNNTKAVSANFRAATNLFMPHSQKLLAGPKFDLPRPWLGWKKSASGDSETGNWAKTLLGGQLQTSERGQPSQSSDTRNVGSGEHLMGCLRFRDNLP
jgi:hypothetical protein